MFLEEPTHCKHMQNTAKHEFIFICNFLAGIFLKVEGFRFIREFMGTRNKFGLFRTLGRVRKKKTRTYYR